MKPLLKELGSEMVAHSWLEIQYLYPTLQDQVQDKENLVKKALEEHETVENELSELLELAEDESSESKVKSKLDELVKNFREHYQEEESKMFPLLKKLIDDSELDKLGSEMKKAKKNAPEPPVRPLVDYKEGKDVHLSEAGKKMLSKLNIAEGNGHKQPSKK